MKKDERIIKILSNLDTPEDIGRKVENIITHQLSIAKLIKEAKEAHEANYQSLIDLYEIDKYRLKELLKDYE